MKQWLKLQGVCHTCSPFMWKAILFYIKQWSPVCRMHCAMYSSWLQAQLNPESLVTQYSFSHSLCTQRWSGGDHETPFAYVCILHHSHCRCFNIKMDAFAGYSKGYFNIVLNCPNATRCLISEVGWPHSRWERSSVPSLWASQKLHRWSLLPNTGRGGVPLHHYGECWVDSP